MSAKGTMSDVMRINDTYYDTVALAAVHPGGDLFVRLSNQTDATAMYVSSHRRNFPHDKYKKYQVDPKLVPEGLIEPMDRDFSLYLELCERIKPVLGKTKGFAPWTYWVKVAFILGVCWFLDVRAIIVGPVFALSLVQGLFAAFIGLNLQHDANHGACSSIPIVNRLIGLSQDYIGGAALGWMINHNVVHHVHCNDVDRDHDIQLPLLRLHHKVQWQVCFVLQQFYFLVLEAMFGLVHVMTNFLLIWKGPNEQQKLLAGYWNTHRLMSLIFPTRLALLVYFHGWALALQHVVTVYCFGGAYLAFFFLLSHNFEGVIKTLDSTTGCFVNLQTVTSCNVGGWLLAQFNGGLNYQIEHHLFPRIHHSWYHSLSPVVRQLCKENGIRYTHYPWVWGNAWSTFLHLSSLGRKPGSSGSYVPAIDKKETVATNARHRSATPKKKKQ